MWEDFTEYARLVFTTWFGLVGGILTLAELFRIAFPKWTKRVPDLGRKRTLAIVGALLFCAQFQVWHELKPNEPSVENVVRMQKPSPKTEAFEIALLNPMDSEMSVTTLGIHVFRGPFAMCADEVSVYDVNLQVVGDQVTGGARESGVADQFEYPLNGKLSKGSCGMVAMDVFAPFNLKIPPRGRSFLRLRVHEVDNILLSVSICCGLDPRSEEEILEDTRREGGGQPSTQPILEESFDWSFTFELNNKIRISGIAPSQMRKP